MYLPSVEIYFLIREKEILMGKFLKVLGIIFIILGILGSLVLAAEYDYNNHSSYYRSSPSSDSVMIFIAGAVASILLGCCVWGLGEIIIKLQEIAANTDEIRRKM